MFLCRLLLLFIYFFLRQYILYDASLSLLLSREWFTTPQFIVIRVSLSIHIYINVICVKYVSSIPLLFLMRY
eukprot:gene11874-8161_t